MILNTIVIAAISALIPLGSVGFGRWFVHWMENKKRRSRPANADEPLRISCARVATDLMPIINRLPADADLSFADAELWVFGSDGRYLTKDNGKKWQDQLKQWSDQGLRIKYVLMDVDEDVREAFSSVCGNTPRLEVMVLREDRSELEPELVNELETCHPTLFMAKGEKNAAWIEGVHRRDSEYAYHVRYLSPNVLKTRRTERAEFESYKHKVERVMQHCDSIGAAVAA